MSSDDEDVVEEVIRGERQLLEAYNAAIEPMDATSPAFSFATEQYRKLEARIDELETIERSLD